VIFMHHLIAAQAEVEQRLCKRHEAVKPIGLASFLLFAVPPLSADPAAQPSSLQGGIATQIATEFSGTGWQLTA
jgi:CBS-domain-containing membrane protein